MKKDYCKYVDVFYGNGEVDHFATEGLSSKWFYIKALCGNTIPHPVLPFGKMSVGPYSSGYPSGYGTHYPNSCGGIQKLSDKHTICGFSHIHHSGTGGIGYYYNYAIVTPFYGEDENINKYYEFENETAYPGYYSLLFNDVECELTVTKDTAYHSYKFKKDGGRIAVDFSNDGLSKLFGERFYAYAKEAQVIKISDDTVCFEGILSGIKMCFCLKVEAQNVKNKLFGEFCEGTFKIADTHKKFGAIFDFEGDSAIVKVSYSTISTEKAKENVERSVKSFEEVKKDAYEIWNKHLSAIDIESKDEDFKKLFYSNFYHSIVKPVDMTGEEILGIKDGVVSEFSTFWDQYKTLLPLIFTLYEDMGSKIVEGIKNLSRALGKTPCSLGLTNIFRCEEQAKMLAIFALCDAYYADIPGVNKSLIEECIKRELEREDYKIFLEKGVFERYTHILDVTDACLCVADITEDKELKAYLEKLAQNWKNAYDADGIMSEKSPYYEGDRYTYSFRLQKNIDERIAFAGGRERFIALLDDFFGFNKESLKQITYLNADEDIENTHYHRFEGFNNECDMETPYAYIYAGRHDKTCEIIHEGVTKAFTLGKGGLPGNNDSGGLSSFYMWSVLGLFPVSGSGTFLIGTPHVEKATLKLWNGKELQIYTNNLSDKNYYVESVEFNGEKICDFTINTQKLMQGGKIVFNMTGEVK